MHLGLAIFRNFRGEFHFSSHPLRKMPGEFLSGARWVGELACEQPFLQLRHRLRALPGFQVQTPFERVEQIAGIHPAEHSERLG